VLRAGELTVDARLSFARRRGGRPLVRAAGSLRLDRARWASASGAPLGAADRIYADVPSADLLGGSVLVARLEVVRPTLIVGHGAGPGPRGWRALRGPPVAVRVEKLAVTGATVLVEDRAGHGIAGGLDGCTLDAWGISTLAGQPLTAGFSCAVSSGGRLSGVVEGTLRPFHLAGTARGHALDLAPLASRPGSLAGAVDLRARFDLGGSLVEPRVEIFAGSATVRDLAVRAPGGGELARVGALDVRDARWEAAAARLVIEEVSGRGARLTLGRRQDGTVDPAPALAPAVLVEHLALDGARLEVRDATLRPPLRLALTDVAFDGAAISSEPDVEGAFTLQARGPRGAALAVDAQILPHRRGADLRVRSRGLSPLALRSLGALLPAAWR
jgi:hypothetical protein